MAVNFSSDDEYIQIRSPNQVDLLDQTEGAVAGAFRTPSVGADDVYIWHGGAAFNESIMLRLQGSDSPDTGQLLGQWRTPNSSAAVFSGTRYDDDAWHWFLWKQSGDTFELIVDGTSVGTVTDSTVGTINVTPVCRIGNIATVDPADEPLNGEVARLGIWRGTPPTSAEVQSWMDDPTAVPEEATLAAHYELWEGGTEWSDAGWHGDGNGTASAVDHPPTSFMGRYDPMWSRTTAIMDDKAFGLVTDSQGVVHAVGHRGGDLVHRKSTDGGQTWGTETVIDAGLTYYAMQYGALHIDGSVLHLLVAEGDMGGTSQPLHYARSTDGGTTWSALPNEVTDGATSIRRANIFTTANRICVFGANASNTNGYFFHSTDGGTTWNQNQITTNRGAGWGIGSGSTVHLAYNGPLGSTGRKTYYLRSTDEGDNFEAEVNLQENSNDDEQVRSRIAIDETGTLVVAWEFRPGSTETNMEIRGKRSTDGGDTFGTAFKIFDDVGDDNNGHLELRAHKGLFVCAQANEDPFQVPENAIEYKYSLDGGVTWQGWEVALNEVGSAVVVYGLAIADDAVHLQGGRPSYTRRSLSDIAVAPQRRSVTLLNA